jgi:thioredoxin reductase (NADPH)
MSRKGQEELIPVSGAFVYLQGGHPITDYLVDQLETTDEGCLRVDSELQTSANGVFAVGDLLCSHIKQAVVAASDGVIAAVAADKYINGRNQLRNDWIRVNQEFYRISLYLSLGGGNYAYH